MKRKRRSYLFKVGLVHNRIYGEFSHLFWLKDNYDLKDYIKEYYPNNTVWYQVRMFSYICERLVSAFLVHYAKTNKYIEFNVITTEEKYAIK